ncbi:MAG: hypothetical protein HQL51_11035 [Magnetococcales bacterium]|nr:hypothetical protein [Magnetococcales bacterium]
MTGGSDVFANPPKAGSSGLTRRGWLEQATPSKLGATDPERIKGGEAVKLTRFGWGFLLAALLATSGGATALAGGPVELQKAKGEACLKPTDWMRRNHMDFLKHSREDTVREGVRNAKESFLNCKSCHVSREQFCDRCHNYASVKPDCFECHNYPK